MEGKAEGKAEEQRLIAPNLKRQRINIGTIAQCTGLSKMYDDTAYSI